MSEIKKAVSNEKLPGTNRIEAFSDGVLAIVITLMVLEIKIPAIENTATNNETWQQLQPVLPKFLAYLLSFVMVAVYWVNHHQLFHSLRNVDRTLLWLNNNFLLWICLLPFPTELIGSHPHSQVFVLIFALLMLLCALSFYLMRWYALKKANLSHETISNEYINASLRKSLIGPILYFIAIISSPFKVTIAYVIFIVVPLLFFVPQKHKQK